MRFSILFISLIFFLTACKGQVPTDKIPVNNPDFDKRLESLLGFDVPLMDTEKLKLELHDFVILDTREKEEYDISHIPNAEFVGYKNLDWEKLSNLEKDQPIVLYCSVGYRSEKIGKKLKKAGFKKVYNLYGSLFEWVNDGYELEDKEGHSTKKIHTYNQKWSKWVDNKNYEKVW